MSAHPNTEFEKWWETLPAGHTRSKANAMDAWDAAIDEAIRTVKALSDPLNHAKAPYAQAARAIEALKPR